MDEIKAYMRENILDGAVDALGTIPRLIGIAASHFSEFGHATKDGRLARIDTAEFELDVPDGLAESVVATIVERGRIGEGHPGDGLPALAAGWPSPCSR